MLQTGLWENKYRQKVLDGQTLNYFSGLRSWPSPNAATGKAGLSPGSLSALLETLSIPSQKVRFMPK